MTAPDSSTPTDDGVSVAAVDDLYTRPENTHLILYLTAFALFVGLAVWGLVAFSQSQSDAESVAKATELSARFQAAGLGALDVDATVRVLGTTGGAACSDPGGELRRGVLDPHVVSGAPGPGQRPIIATSNVIEGARIVIETYCPEQLADFESYVDELKLVDDE